MANMKVVVGFMHEGRQFNVGDILSVSSKSDQMHLVQTKQAIYETYDFAHKEENIDVLREKYLEKFDKEADKRWKVSRLLEELDND